MDERAELERRPRQAREESEAAYERSRKIGASVRQERMRRGWRQEDLAKRAGVPRSRLARIETGRVDRPSIRDLDRLAEALEVTLGYLLLPDHPFRGMVRTENPSFEQQQMLEAASEGLVGRLVHAGSYDPIMLRDMAQALLQCHGDSLSKEVLETWLNNGTGGRAG